MPKDDPQEIRKAMTDIAQKRYNGRRLVLDPNNRGRIQVIQPGERPQPDAVIMDQIAEEGFFT